MEIWRVGKRKGLILGMVTGEKYVGDLQCLSLERGDHITFLSLMMNLWSNLLCSLSPVHINSLLPALELGRRLTLSCRVQPKHQKQTQHPKLTQLKKEAGNKVHKSVASNGQLNLKGKYLKYQCKHSLL